MNFPVNKQLSYLIWFKQFQLFCVIGYRDFSFCWWFCCSMLGEKQKTILINVAIKFAWHSDLLASWPLHFRRDWRCELFFLFIFIIFGESFLSNSCSFIELLTTINFLFYFTNQMRDVDAVHIYFLLFLFIFNF